MQQLTHYIDGEQRPPTAGHYLDSVDPARGAVYCRVPAGDAQDVAAAYAAAERAFPAWSNLPAAERARYLEAIADAIDARLEELARAECIDNGKPLSLARRVDIPRARDNFRFFARAITQFASEFHDMGSTGFNYTLRRPLGVVGLISPWNLPLYLFTWKIAPALAAGNTAIAKPSEVTPRTAALLGEICEAVGLPAGVLNIVHGEGPAVGEAIVTHPGVKAISFTGSTRVGQRIAEVAGPAFKKLSLEMGGKNATIVFDDANYETALEIAVRASFTNQGQICLCGSRVLVQQSIYDRFEADFVKKVKALKIGDPLEDDTRVGAIVSAPQLEKDLHYIQLARDEGGRILTGGERLSGPNARTQNGYFLAPTVIAGLGPQCRVNQEEIFGPVASLIPFEDEKEALEIANGTPYGLSASIWTQSLERAHRVAAELACGIVWVNSWMVRDLRTPFGGSKQSGVGREGGYEALRFFTEPKNVFVKMGSR